MRSIVRSLGAAALPALVLALAACGSPAAPELTDPAAIVEAALGAAEDATSVHVEVEVEGKAPVSLPMVGGGAPIDLTGTSATADVDLERTAASAEFHVPTLFNLSGKAIVVDGTAYVQSSMTGERFQRFALGTGPSPIDAGTIIDNLGDMLLSDGVTLTKGPDEACGGATCYTVTTSVTAEQLAGLTGVLSALPIDLSGATADVTIRVDKAAPNHLVGLTVDATISEQAELTIDATFSDWNAAVTVTAPSPDQVAGG